MMFSSRTLAERSATCPLCLGSGRIATGPWGARPPKKVCPECKGAGTIHHGKLEANPVLIETRHNAAMRSYTPAGAVRNQLAAMAWGEWSGHATSEQRTHAKRVLTLWMAVFG